MNSLTSRQEAEVALREELALIYKHSSTCPISAMAQLEVQQFDRTHPDVPVYRVDVHSGREVSRFIAEKTGIEHHSPQAILLRDGKPEWHASHFDVTTAALEAQLEQARGE